MGKPVLAFKLEFPVAKREPRSCPFPTCRAKENIVRLLHLTPKAFIGADLGDRWLPFAGKQRASRLRIAHRRLLPFAGTQMVHPFAGTQMVHRSLYRTWASRSGAPGRGRRSRGWHSRGPSRTYSRDL